MKRILIIIAAAVFSAGLASAQDMQQATDSYNNGAMALQMGDNQGALDAFRQALTMAEACGDEGTDIINNCKDIIPKVELAIAKDLIKASEFDKAIEQLGKAVTVANEYGNNDVATEASTLIPQVYMSQAGQLLNAKDYDGAIAAYEKVVAADTTNGTAILRLGMAYGAASKVAEAEKAFTAAMRHGEEKNAVKQLSNMYLKLAAADLKAKNYNGAIDHALKANGYLENATSMQIAGTAATQLDRKADAIKYLESYIALAPNARNINQMYYTIAVLAQQSGDNAKACGYYKKITGDPQYGAAAKQQITTLKCN